MTERSTRAVAWGSLGLAFSLCGVAAVFLGLAWDSEAPATQFGPRGFTIAFSVVFAVVGSVVASRRPSNPIGWIFCGVGLLAGIQAVGSEYARWALLAEDGRPPGGVYGAWLEEWLWIPLVASLGVTAAIFPDGSFRSRPWRIVIVIAIAAASVPMVLNALIPELTIYEGFDNPLGVGGDSLADAAVSSVGLLMPLVILGAVSAIVRFRRSTGEERLQLKWLALAVTMVAAGLSFYAVFAVISFSSGGTGNPAGVDWAENLMIASFLAVPISIGFGVLKYRLYDIDLVVNKAVVYAGLAVFITLVYVGLVVGVGAAVGARGNTLLSALAAAVVALAFQPARRRAQHLANRIVYGKRATPYEVLSELSSRFAGTYSLHDALPRLARVAAEAVGAESTRVWLRTDSELRASASWPAEPREEVRKLVGDELPMDVRSEVAFAVRHQGQLLGAISVRMPLNEPLGPPQEKLLGDVAAQAGLVLRNVALVEDLRASRRRIVTAQDDRARALERDIHDGAQQQLVALSVRLRLAQQLAEREPGKVVPMIGELQAETQSALENIRDLARGIYPPLLADKGLAEALRAQARKASVPVHVESDGLGRYPREVESAVYFCVLEALQNVAKYAGATAAEVRLRQDDGHLEFAVRDDGSGFDPSTTPPGAGLQNMADRLAAVDGSLDVRSRPGDGTTIAGRIPVRGDV
jgi:signal transduction histidine kinase